MALLSDLEDDPAAGCENGAGAPPAVRLRWALRKAHRAPEPGMVRALGALATPTPETRERVLAAGRVLVEHVRAARREVGGIDALMHHYDLSSPEGVALMCLAEALLRIPDGESTDRLIEDKLGGGDWQAHLGRSDSLFVNASTFGLMIAGRTLSMDEQGGAILAQLTRRLGEPVIREAVRRSMRILGHQFVLGRNLREALHRAAPQEQKGERFSFDMLGEAARTARDADRYFAAYLDAVRTVGEARRGRDTIVAPGVSVKLSALDPRYEFAQRERVRGRLRDRLLALCEAAAEAGVSLCVDAEEADRLDLSLDLIEAAALARSTGGWTGLGLAVQAYQKRAPALIDWLEDLASRSGRRLLVRLVKGAYWDTEIKRAQEGGFPDYPVFTRKEHTDVAYLACARKLLDARDAFYPCFATHNAHTLASVAAFAGDRSDYEFQRLHGMGEALYEKREAVGAGAVACRVYAPVGTHEELLAYLVRRLLENGANASFVNRIADDDLPVDAMLRDPVAVALSRGYAPHPDIPLPPDLYGPGRRNSRGRDLADPLEVVALDRALAAHDDETPEASPVVAGEARRSAEPREVRSPADRRRRVGAVRKARAADARDALSAAAAAHAAWAERPAEARARLLERAADALEDDEPAFLRLLVREAGRSLADAHLEVREAVDFLRYYAGEARRLQGAPVVLPGPTGERNTLRLVGRGPFLCIAPWNFPLAIFLGQASASLAAGCPALAKPAEQTPLVGARAVALLHEAGVPAEVLHFLPGDGPEIGGALLGEPALAGVAFTGSVATAKVLQQALAERAGPILPLIAETGGVNGMIVDSTALPEQVTRDVIASAFRSAGQRCSALRLLCLQEDVADRHEAMIAGAIRELRVGDPMRLGTDVGPVIDDRAAEHLRTYVQGARRRWRTVAEAPAPAQSLAEHGRFVRPIAFAVDAVEDVRDEVFGPVLHVVRFSVDDLDDLVDRINALGFGLTLDVHSRSESRVERIARRARVGNVYVNRNQIGAVVGVQPFGGEGLSGTGPKAGGPNYLPRFCVERALSEDTTATGGNPALYQLGD